VTGTAFFESEPGHGSDIADRTCYVRSGNGGSWPNSAVAAIAPARQLSGDKLPFAALTAVTTKMVRLWVAVREASS
jgi:hypothetical protein